VFRDHLAADSLKAAAEESLKKLGTDYVDLLLIHWPNERVPLQETLGAMQELQEAGEVRNIGVSNFTVGLMQEAEEVAESPIFCNQVEYHPFLSQEPVLRWCREHGLLLTAYSPLARGKVLDEPVLERIGETHGKTPAQVALRWMMQQEGVVAIPKASSEDHLRQNLAITDFELSEDEMEEVSGLARGERIIDPSVFPTPEWDT
jgi:2,5-diketo-D-gluconate reductase B